MKRGKSKIVADAICGILMLVSIFVYIVLGLTISWWHPGWIVIVGAALASGVISICMNLSYELKKSETENKDETTENKQ